MKLYGCPPNFLGILEKIYCDTRIKVRCGSSMSDWFSVASGVRQGDPVAPFLCIIALDFILRQSDLPSRGLTISDTKKILDLDYADDICLFSNNVHDLQEHINDLHTASLQLGLQINVKKTKFFTNSWSSPTTEPRLFVGKEEIENVHNFVYLGSCVPFDGGSQKEIIRRIALASSAFRSLNKIWTSNSFALHTKLRLLNSNVLPVLLYGSESWCPTKALIQRCVAFENNCLRKILGVTWRDRVTNRKVRQVTKQPLISATIKKRRWTWLGHVLRTSDDLYLKSMLEFVPIDGTRKRGRPTYTILRNFENELRNLNMTWDEVRRISLNRPRWRSLVFALCSFGDLRD